MTDHPVPSGESETLEERALTGDTRAQLDIIACAAFGVIQDARAALGLDVEESLLGAIVHLRARLAEVQTALAEAAAEIPCAGPVAHRIRVMREEHATEVARLTAELENAYRCHGSRVEELTDAWAQRDAAEAKAARYREALEAAEARAAQLEEALVALDDTCDEVVGALTHAVYEAMLDAGMEDALDALDSARRDAVSLIQHTEAFRPVQEKRYARIRSLTTEGGDRAE